MNRGFHLTLMAGSFNASPVPEAVIDALTDVQVTTTMGSQGGFQLKFTIARNSAFALLHQSGFFNPRQRVIIAVTVNGTTDVLMDGIVTKQDLTPSGAAGKSTLTVTGLDLTALAGKVGAVFYLDPGPTPGTSMAYWGPDLTKMFGGTQGALNINFDGNSNLNSLSFSYDGTLAVNYMVTIVEPITKLPIPIPLPSIDLIKAPQAAHAPPALKFLQLKPIASEDPIGAALAALGKLFESADVVTANGQLDVMRYGRVFKARQLCGVRGAGAMYDGLYYVKSVTHNIKRGEYKQSFQLARGGTGSSVQRVSP